MLDQVDLNQKLSKEEYKRLCAPLKKQLSVLQQTIKEKRLPVSSSEVGRSPYNAVMAR